MLALLRRHPGPLALLALTLVLAACQPWFPAGSTLTVTADGPLVRLSWDVAQDIDAGDSIASYGIEVDGVEVDTVSGAVATCILTGLAPGSTHDLSVTAYDTTGQWSGSLPAERADEARVTTTWVQSSIGDAGSTPECVSIVDTDGDRLPDAVETDTGTYVDAGDTGSDPLVADTDGDGIRDGDEVLGTTAGTDLPAMGLSPVKKDLLFEFDWFDDNAEPSVCASHSHRPTAAMLTRVANTFAAAPVANPDGSTGIHVVGDYGQGGPYTGGNLVADADGVIAGGVSGTEFMAIKAAQFSADREGIFHYVLLPHRYGTTSSSSGQAEVFGDDLIVSLYCYGSTGNVANTIVHEVGHNLGLLHGGGNSVNYKPNYNSVMNYEYQFSGVDTNCTVPGDGLLDYSHGTRAALNENALVEANGICGGVAIDWNGNSSIDAATVAVDINQSGGTREVLTDFDDWAAIQLHRVVDADGASPTFAEPQIVTEQPVPPSARQ